jgi:hypothetical protein
MQELRLRFLHEERSAESFQHITKLPSLQQRAAKPTCTAFKEVLKR